MLINESRRMVGFMLTFMLNGFFPVQQNSYVSLSLLDLLC